MTPIFEARLVPIDRHSSIVHIIVRVDDAENIKTHDQCVEFLEKQFPYYEVSDILKGYKEGMVNTLEVDE